MLSHLASGGMGQVYLAKSTGLGGFERKVVVKTLEPTAPRRTCWSRCSSTRRGCWGSSTISTSRRSTRSAATTRAATTWCMDYVRGETAETGGATATDRGVALPLASRCRGHGDRVGARLRPRAVRGRWHATRDRPPRRLAVEPDDWRRRRGQADRLRHREVQAPRPRAPRSARSRASSATSRPSRCFTSAIDHRVDVFALGVVLYELTTMKRAFLGSSELIIAREDRRAARSVRPSAVVPGYPVELSRRS